MAGFLPWKTSIKKGEIFGLVPKRGTVIVYEQPDAMINHEPEKAMKVFKKMLELIEEDISEYGGFKLNVISYSAGNGFGFYVANHFAVKKFISIVTGANLGECIFTCIATPHVKKESINFGINSHNEYDKVIEGYIPQDNFKNISAKSTFYLARFDEYFELKQGLKVANYVKQHNKNTEIKIIPLGHLATMVYFGFLNRFSLIEDIYKK